MAGDPAHPEAPAAARAGSPLAAFKVEQFPVLWLAAAVFSFAQWVERVAIGWFVLEETGSVFLTTLAWSVRVAPSMVLGPVTGAIADRFDRSRVLMVASLLKGAVLALTALLVVADAAHISLILLLVAISGTTLILQIAALQPLVTDVVGRAASMNAISVVSLGQRAVGIGGALAGGVLVARAGAETAFLVAAVLLAAAAWGFGRVRMPKAAPRGTSFRSDVTAGLRLIVAVPMVGILLGMMIAVEVLGFSVNSLLPVVADEVLDVGAEGLGVLTGATAFGSMLGLGALAMLGDYRHKGLLLLAVSGSFGVALLLFAASTIFVVSLLVAAAIGAAMAMVDTIEWIMLQEHVEDEMRGRAIGVWNLAIGVGWIGPLALGGLAELAGVQGALVTSGILLLAITAVAALALPKLRGA